MHARELHSDEADKVDGRALEGGEAESAQTPPRCERPHLAHLARLKRPHGQPLLHTPVGKLPIKPRRELPLRQLRERGWPGGQQVMATKLDPRPMTHPYPAPDR